MRVAAFRFALGSAVAFCICAMLSSGVNGPASANPQDNLQQGQNLPDLMVREAHAQVGQPCQQGGALIVVSVTIGNAGSAGSNVLDGGVIVREPNGPLSGSATLPQIGPGGSANVTVAIYAQGNPSQFAGGRQLFVAVNEQHAIAESDYANNGFGPISVLIPANLCRGSQPVNTPPPATVRPVTTTKPDFSILRAGVRLEPYCRRGLPIARAYAIIANGGGSYRATDRRNDFIIARDSVDANYIGSMGLPSLDGGRSVPVSFPIFYTGKNLDAVAGTRQFRIVVNKNRTVDESNFANNAFEPASLTIPADFCHPKRVIVRSNAMLYPTIRDIKKYARAHVLSTPPPVLHVMGPGTGILGATLSSSSTSYAGPCPATMSFNGTVLGTAGTKFTLSFNRFVNGVQTIVDKGSFTMPATGSLAVSDSISVGASASVLTFDQIWVHNITPTQPDVYGNKVDFTVSCGGAPPTATPGPSGLVDYIGTPGSLRKTVDPTECGKHSSVFGSLFCPGAIKDPSKVVLVWEWPAEIFCPEGKSCYKRIDGYHAFKSSGSSGLVKVATIDDQDQKARAFTFAAGDCYVVRAYYRSLESANSNEFCLPPAGGPAVVTTTSPLVRAQSYSRSIYHEANDWYCTGAPFATLDKSGSGSGVAVVPPAVDLPVQVGNSHRWDAGTEPFPCWEYSFGVSRAALLFNLDAFKGKYVDKATLTYSAAGDPPTCASQLLTASEDWTGKDHNSYTPPGDLFEYLPMTMTGDHFAVDVTKALRDWQSYGNNFGFVIRSEDESPKNHNGSCRSYLSDFKLEVQYFASP
ncbi:MAG TPA: hypothetical protein VN934_11710 [Candidatus Tumulicola sp.]|nr:hypothetical protein [Candidatus Tumulicola sp.]